MAFKDSHGRYGTMSIFNHWIVGLSMIAMLAFGLYIADLPKGPEKFELIGLHKSFGALILIYGLWRVFWRLVSGFVTPVEGTKPLEAKMARLAHFILLASVIIMPFSGYFMSELSGYSVKVFDWFTMPELTDNKELGGIAHNVHEYFGLFTIAVVVLHFLAAWKHHLFNKDNTLKRMLSSK